MMQVLQKSEATNPKTWTNIFPLVSTASDSLIFLKRLTDLAISTILYMRKVVPDSEFENQIFDGMTLKLLKNEPNDANIRKIRTWLIGAFDALEKSYLKNIILEIKDAPSDLTLELYTITIGNDAGNPTVSVSSLSGEGKKTIFRNSKEKTSNMQAQTVRFLQMCYTVAKASSELPSEVMVSMKLRYHENAPQNYQPFGFKPYKPTKSVFLKKSRSIEIGIIHTNHHYLKFVNKTCLSDETLIPKVGERKTEGKSDGSSMMTSSLMKPKIRSPSDQVEDILSQQKYQIGKDRNKSQFTDDGPESVKVRCPCLSQMKNSVMYRCSGCNYWVHAECFGILLSLNPPQIDLFYCQICHTLNREYTCHDKDIIRLNRASDQQKLAVQRRLLSFCRRINDKEVTFTRFEKVSGLACQQSFLKSILNEMVGWGLLSEKPGNAYFVDRNKILGKMSQFFYMGSPMNSKTPTDNTNVKLNEPKTPKLGKRKLDLNNEDEKKIHTSSRTQPERTAKSLSIVKYFSQFIK